MLHRKTDTMLLAAAAVLLCANTLTLRIPFDDGDHAAGDYMIKTGWPCAFIEQTRNRLFWEWPDLLIDSIVALGLLAAIGFGSELVIRRNWNYSRFHSDVALRGCTAGIEPARTDGSGRDRARLFRSWRW